MSGDLRFTLKRRLVLGVLVSTCSIATLFAIGCSSSGQAPAFHTETEVTPAEQNIGERIFVDTRWAEYFATHMTDVNTPLTTGDPVVAQTQTLDGPLPGPFAGQSINCRSCHFVVEFQGVKGAGNRTYADFTTRSPIPRPMNGFTFTPRNSMQMVGSLQPHNGPQFLHFDGEFVDPADLVKKTLTGRNFGWDPTQSQAAIAHIADVVRNDNGKNDPANEFGCGLPYRTVLLGTDPAIPSSCKMSAQYLLDATTASDEQIIDDIAQIVAQYAKGLRFKHDEFGRYIKSPYDVFLRVNHLPTQPKAGETNTQYAQRLLGLLDGLNNPTWVTPADGSFRYHAQAFAFGTTEFAGLKIFLRATSNATDGSQHAGNCASCHVPPDFTDFQFHNNGAAQEEYDTANGAGAFLKLIIPSQADRLANFNAYLPASSSHPNATESFRHAAVAGSPQFADLGLWNIYLNPDIPNPQSQLQALICANAQNCAVDQGLPSTIAQFKTPTLRDGEDSQPYFHNGSKTKFNDVVEFYIRSSALAHQGALRNAGPQFGGMSLSEDDVNALVAFLASLTEDYDDA